MNESCHMLKKEDSKFWTASIEEVRSETLHAETQSTSTRLCEWAVLSHLSPATTTITTTKTERLFHWRERVADDWLDHVAIWKTGLFRAPTSSIQYFTRCHDLKGRERSRKFPNVFFLNNLAPILLFCSIYCQHSYVRTYVRTP
jgi:hypothetical protein